MNNTQRLIAVTLDAESTGGGRNHQLDLERTRAVADLIDANYFAPHGQTGPYRLHLGTREGRLVFTLHPEATSTPHTITLSLQPLRSIVRDYFLVCESYHEAV